MNPRDKFTTMNKYRLAFLCRWHGSPDETPESVPADERAEFAENVAINDQDRQRIFDKIVRHYGAVFFEDLPPQSQAKALRKLDYMAAVFENDCRYELEILRIEQAEALERTFDEEIA